MRKVIINIGEKDYEIKFDINALIDLAGDGIDVLKIDKIEMDLKAIRTMFKHGLKHDMKKITDKNRHVLLCPICKYVVDNVVPKQNYCDRCGQKLK